MALEAALFEKGLVGSDAIDELIETFEHRMGPHHGARAVARAWTDAGFKERLLADGTAGSPSSGSPAPRVTYASSRTPSTSTT